MEFSSPQIRSMLGQRSIVIVGMMGAGKTTIGRLVASPLRIPFLDSDSGVEAAAGMTIPEIFAHRGEHEFRVGERRVIARLLSDGPKVLSTGGGAWMDEATRAQVASQGLSVWLKADVDVLMARVRRKANRPLLKSADPEATLRRLLDERGPVYALADITVESHDVEREVVAREVLQAVGRHLRASVRDRATPDLQEPPPVPAEGA